MESIQPKYETLSSSNTESPNMESFSGKNILIIVLVGLLALSFMGFNLLDYINNVIKTIVAIFTPIIRPILSLLGYTTGAVINKTADVVSDTAKTGIDIAEGTVQSVGDLLISASKGGVDTTQLDSALNISRQKTVNDPDADTTANPIQNPISSNKVGWCLVGEVADKRGCIMVEDEAKCMSGQIFPSKKMCLNPTLTNGEHV
jgi:hypothetical protein